jgi:hypothetical protein
MERLTYVPILHLVLENLQADAINSLDNADAALRIQTGSTHWFMPGTGIRPTGKPAGSARTTTLTASTSTGLVFTRTLGRQGSGR